MSVQPQTIRLADVTPGELRERLATALAAGDAVVALDGCERLAVEVLEILLALGAANRGRIRLRGASAPVARALVMADGAGVLVVDGGRPIVGDRPFTLAFPAPGTLLVRLGRDAGGHRLLADTVSHDWLRGLLAECVRIDLGDLTHINSLLIAWLIQAGQAGAPGRVELINVHAQAATQLGQLRLTHLLPIVTG